MALIDNLVSYWKLDEASGNALDSHGSNDLTETSGTIAATSGKISGCRDFEAIDTEYFTRASNSDLQVGDIDFSFAMWINPESISSFPTFLSKDTGASREYGFLINDSDSNRVRFAISADGSGLVTVTATNFGSLSTGTWYFVAGGHNATSNEIWVAINAGTPNTQAHSGGVFTGTSNFAIGARPDGSIHYDGLIDEVGFWKRDIRSDLAALYNGGAGLAYPFVSGNPHNYYAQQQ